MYQSDTLALHVPDPFSGKEIYRQVSFMSPNNCVLHSGLFKDVERCFSFNPLDMVALGLLTLLGGDCPSPPDKERSAFWEQHCPEETGFLYLFEYSMSPRLHFFSAHQSLSPSPFSTSQHTAEMPEAGWGAACTSWHLAQIQENKR